MRPDDLTRAHSLAMAAKQTVFQAQAALEREVMHRDRAAGHVDHRLEEMALALQQARFALEDFDRKRTDLQIAEGDRGPVSRPRVREE